MKDFSPCSSCGEAKDVEGLGFPNCCKHATLEFIQDLESKICDAYTVNGLPCKHMDNMINAIDKKHFDGQLQDIFCDDDNKEGE